MEGFSENQFSCRQEDFIAPESYFSPKRLYSAFRPFNFQGEDSSFLEIGGTNGGMSESEKGKCRIENDVIVSGTQDTRILDKS